MQLRVLIDRSVDAQKQTLRFEIAQMELQVEARLFVSHTHHSIVFSEVGRHRSGSHSISFNKNARLKSCKTSSNSMRRNFRITILATARISAAYFSCRTRANSAPGESRLCAADKPTSPFWYFLIVSSTGRGRAASLARNALHDAAKSSLGEILPITPYRRAPSPVM